MGAWNHRKRQRVALSSQEGMSLGRLESILRQDEAAITASPKPKKQKPHKPRQPTRSQQLALFLDENPWLMPYAKALRATKAQIVGFEAYDQVCGRNFVRLTIVEKPLRADVLAIKTEINFSPLGATELSATSPDFKRQPYLVEVRWALANVLLRKLAHPTVRSNKKQESPSP